MRFGYWLDATPDAGIWNLMSDTLILPKMYLVEPDGNGGNTFYDGIPLFYQYEGYVRYIDNVDGEWRDKLSPRPPRPLMSPIYGAGPRMTYLQYHRRLYEWWAKAGQNEMVKFL